jgi:basic amino acid/polyamine antiporter, APA family
MAENSNNKISFNTAIAIVVANMVGSGVFTSLFFQTNPNIGNIQAIFPLLMLWFFGGIIALCGALSYGELAALMPRSGGEYHFLSKIYHPALGFLSGWVSATVGFSAPIALAATGLGRYANSVSPILNPTVLAIVVIVLITLIHATDVKLGGTFQRYSTLLKVLLIVGFILCGFLFTAEPTNISPLPQTNDWSIIFSTAFAGSLAYVSFSYSGWNAAAYLASEIDNPRKNVPRSLFLGTLVVMTLYVLLNFTFLYTAPMAKISAGLEVGYTSANYIFGDIGGKIMGSMIALLLVSSISSMVFAGPRVTQAMGQDIPLLNTFARTNSKGIPLLALVIQSSISIILVLTASFESILNYIAFTLDIFTTLTVLGVFVMRFRQPKAERVYKTWGYPVTPLIFLAATTWTMYVIFQRYPNESLIALGVVLLGLIVYLADKYSILERK